MHRGPVWQVLPVWIWLGSRPMFIIGKLVSDGNRIWLSRAFPFVTWGPVTEAARYPAESHAWQTIGRLLPREAEGAMVIATQRSLPTPISHPIPSN